MVLGGIDTGKSSFCLFVTQELFRAGSSVALLDADIGQKDVGPPTTIGLRHLIETDFSAERPLQADALYFVGSNTPVGHLLPLVVGTKLLLDQSTAQITVINTTGLIHGPGVALKTFKIESLRPDLIIAFERGKELSPLLEGFRFLEILRLPVPEEVGRKDLQRRRENREAAYKRYFEKGKEISLPRREIIVQRPRPFTPNLLCGLSDGQKHLGLALIERQEKDTLFLFTPVPKEKIKVLICGSILVKLPGVELKKLTVRKGSFPSRKHRSLPRPQPGPERRRLQTRRQAPAKRDLRRNRASTEDRTAPEKGEQSPRQGA